MISTSGVVVSISEKIYSECNARSNRAGGDRTPLTVADTSWVGNRIAKKIDTPNGHGRYELTPGCFHDPNIP